MTNFEKVNPKQSFPKLEENIIKFWKENDTFKKSIENRADSEEFNFYDGPPFATGTPHYGHILAGAIKDVIPRYQTMKGKKVERNFGWDTHGLPIENIVEKKLEIKGKEDLENRVGIHTFNETCRENVFGYVDEWEKIVDRMGRWVDMENDYKTMDTDFMESVWWVFSEVYKKGLIYEGYRVVPYSVGMCTPLSNFEVNQGYKDKQSKTVTVKFKVGDPESSSGGQDGSSRGQGKKYLLAWTTTPWTLYANLGLAVGKDILYSEILDKQSGETYILASELVKTYYKKEEDYTLVREYKGSCLAGIKYEPLFNDFKIQLEDMGADLGTGISLGKNSYSVVLGHHVTTESGTGIVHIAPAYGEDDNLIGKEQDLGFVAHINDAGNTYNLLEKEKNGQFVFDFSENVITELKERKLSIHIGTINHSYPHCWRSGVPLIYRAISAWYVDVTAIKEKMIANNQKINWVPDEIKNGRMGKWLEGARDWNISRNRYWGSAMPIWQSSDKKEEVCVGSIEELYELNKDFGQITKVIFIRHGRTDYNEKGLMDYQNEAQLTEIGKSQAEEIATIFANEKIDAIYSSPLDRCIDTITPLAKSQNLEVEKIDNFVEIQSPDLQAKEFSCKNYKWENGYGGGETIKEVYERVEKSLQEIIEKNKGKTIVVCAHGDTTFLGRMSLHNDINYDTDKYTSGKYLENNPEKYDISKIYGVEYVYTKSKKAVDIHKHFVDEILVKNEKNFVAKNVLGIHGYTCNLEKNDFWLSMKDNLEKNNISLTLPQFPSIRETDFSEWESILDSKNIKDVETVVAHSLGTRVALEYILKNNIKLKRLILISPSITAKRSNGSKRPELLNFFQDYKFGDIKNRFDKIKDLVDEVIIIHSKEDESVPFNEGKKLAGILGVSFIEVNGYKHFNEKEHKLLDALTIFGMPLQRIPEVLDCWFESGSMPYASKHYMGTSPLTPLLKGEGDSKNSPSPGGEGAGGGGLKFPADFIAEGLDQTRGWFYTLIILGTALFENTPFLNCIVNGIILAEDGKKMSKSLKNYPDPDLIFNKYGADAMRFYLLNSPVVEADDFRFAESGVEEVVKKVMLPLWNTYYFFTTYANIDNFIPTSGRGMSERQENFSDSGNIYFVRHGETDNNKYKRVNGGKTDVDLNEVGIEQAHETGKLLQSKNLKIDKIICSPMQRAKHTAEIIKSYIGNVEIKIQNDLREMNYGSFCGKTLAEVAEEYKLENKHNTIWKYIFSNCTEKLEDFLTRIQNIVNTLRTTEGEKNILIVAHSGTYKAILSENNPAMTVDDFVNFSSPKNAGIFNLNQQKSNKLDSWLISELNELTKEVSTGFDSYKLRDAATPIVKFMDNLTNWYIRRSRKRFWKSENDGDKIEAYETLYFALIELTKIIAPFMPFISEHIYKNLTGNESVHLEDFPTYDESLINEKLNAQTDKIQKIITLGLAFRANQKIRVRQPLQSITITEDFEDYFKEILKEELNVKEILVVNGETLAKKVCKPNGRNIGPKFGKDVKFIMSEAKSGNFEELENGNVLIPPSNSPLSKGGETEIPLLAKEGLGDISQNSSSPEQRGFILEQGDFELVFEAEDSEKLIETGFGMVISMDINITEELKQEGFARDLVRHIQEARKEADYNVEDRIEISIILQEESSKLLENFGKYIETETLSTIKENLEQSDFEKEVEIEGERVKLILKK